MWERALAEHMPGGEIRAYDITDSTNAQAKQWARQGAPHGAMVIADRQTAGRGRLGREFVSPEKAGVYMTVVLWPGAQAMPLLTCAAAVAVCQAIEALSPVRPGIKWVNDLFVNERKVCGILAEAVSAPSGDAGAVVGIGVNLCAAALPDGLRGIAGDIGADIARDELAVRIWENLLRWVENASDGQLMQEYRARSFLPGREVQYQQNGEWHAARAVGIGDAGELLVQDAQGHTHVLRAGEVTMHRE